ncbi:MAG: CoA-transferase [Deltaproteobacteria bacterium]|nr:CoA-transferase [Deltaproteobacteria bacterium]
MTPPLLGDVLAVACADAFRGDGAILASPMAPMPALGAKLARAVFEPQLLLTDGAASLQNVHGELEGRMSSEKVFDMALGGRRHVMMGASQLDRHGNQNISCIGPYDLPTVQLIGVSSAPGNTVHHTTSYFVDHHNTRVFVPRVDMVSGVGPRRGARDIRCIITNLCVFDLSGPHGTIALASLHPGVTVDAVRAATGFEVHVPESVSTSRTPTKRELRWLEHLDPRRVLRSRFEPNARAHPHP